MNTIFKTRTAGILLHVSSLPGKYPVGDFGQEVYSFIQQLKKAKLSIWQLLPLNALDSTKGFSPYSPLSAFAGNTLFINPEKLLEKGFLDALPEHHTFKNKQKVHYEKAVSIKAKVLDAAFQYYLKHKPEDITRAFNEFCQKESYWLDDYALYSTLRNELNLPWFYWPKELRDREPGVLQKISVKNKLEIEREKYFQFLFYSQWSDIRKYASEMGITIIGDIPIYISHDSADVWSNSKYFKLKANKEIAMIAGVPPDYFNDEGQLWNMPVYNWKVLEEENYDWWIKRLTKNLELFDIVRLDHFRGFSAYWEVKGGSENAIGGKWKRGPGSKLFDHIKKEFPDLPFIAEDLGDIDQPVYDLRDQYNLPGMRVLQFAFEGDMPKSIFIPHNFVPNAVAYTGTHDNNTVTGWFTNELSKKGKKNLSRYLNKKIKKKNVHKELVKECYKSVTSLAIVPMQDVLGLNEKFRMNFPSTSTGNWLWRMKEGAFTSKHINWLKKITKLYNRG